MLQEKLPTVYESTQEYVQEQVEWREAKEKLLTVANSLISKTADELKSKYEKQEILDSDDKTRKDIELP